MERKINNGFFFVIDGIDRSGTNTYCKLLGDHLKQKRDVFLNEEPFSDEIGNLIR